MSALEVIDATVRFGSLAAVDSASVAVAPGAVLAVLGPSGCGKSTLLRAIAGLEVLAEGRVVFDGKDLAREPVHKRGFALMFQDGQLFDHLNVADNVGYPLRVRGRGDPARVAELLELVGLGGYAGRDPRTLSGGERQRVALARALAAEPRLLLLDEPLSALDPTLRVRLAEDLNAILRATGTTTVMVTHDQEEAFTVADRLAVMKAGRIVQQGSLSEVWSAPVDEDTALFLGYSSVVDGTQVGLPPGRVALRRSALVVDPHGDLVGGVRSARATPELTRLTVTLADGSEQAAVADPGVSIAAGEQVRLRLDPSRTGRVAATS